MWWPWKNSRLILQYSTTWNDRLLLSSWKLGEPFHHILGQVPPKVFLGKFLETTGAMFFTGHLGLLIPNRQCQSTECISLACIQKWWNGSPGFQLRLQLRIRFCHMTKCILELQRHLERHSNTERSFKKPDWELLWVGFYNPTQISKVQHDLQCGYYRNTDEALHWQQNYNIISLNKLVN